MSKLNEDLLEAAANIDDEEVWQKICVDSAASGLTDLERELRCSICCTFFRAPVSVQDCQHVFCSECIRLSIRKQMTSGAKRLANCPQCQTEITIKGTAKHLVPNRKVEALVKCFQQLRKPLMQVLSSRSSADSDSVGVQINTETADSEDDSKMRATRRRSARGVVDVFTASQGDAKKTEQQCTPDPSKQPLATARKKRPDPNFTRRNKKDLQEMCAKEGLPTGGTEEEITARLSKYHILYNSECDALDPKPVAELVRIICQREKEELHARKLQNQTARLESVDYVKCVQKLYRQREILGKDPNATWEKVTTGCAAFDAKLEENFDALIAQYKDRKAKAGETSKLAKNLSALKNKPTDKSASLHAKSTGEASAATITRESISNASDDSDKKIIEVTTMVSSVCNPYARTRACAGPSSLKPYVAMPSSSSSLAAAPETQICTESIPFLAFPDASAISANCAVSQRLSSDSFTSSEPWYVMSESCNASLFTAGISVSTSQQTSKASYVDQNPIGPVESELRACQESPAATRLLDLSAESSDSLALGSTGELSADHGKRKSPLRQSQLNVSACKKSKVVTRSVTNGGQKPTLLRPWSCGACTFINKKNRSMRSQCEMCGVRRSSDDTPTVYDVE
jgi:RING-type zinc-finger